LFIDDLPAVGKDRIWHLSLAHDMSGVVSK
jgi:hypothetical protein